MLRKEREREYMNERRMEKKEERKKGRENLKMLVKEKKLYVCQYQKKINRK